MLIANSHSVPQCKEFKAFGFNLLYHLHCDNFAFNILGVIIGRTKIMKRNFYNINNFKMLIAN